MFLQSRLWLVGLGYSRNLLSFALSDRVARSTYMHVREQFRPVFRISQTSECSSYKFLRANIYESRASSSASCSQAQEVHISRVSR